MEALPSALYRVEIDGPHRITAHVGGGVARNQRLQAMVQRMAADRGATMFVPPGDLCIDNGAMIAWTGLQMFRGGVRMTIPETVVDQRFRTDEVPVTWR